MYIVWLCIDPKCLASVAVDVVVSVVVCSFVWICECVCLHMSVSAVRVMCMSLVVLFLCTDLAVWCMG